MPTAPKDVAPTMAKEQVCAQVLAPNSKMASKDAALKIPMLKRLSRLLNSKLRSRDFNPYDFPKQGEKL